MIRSITPQYDEKGVLKPRQTACATCKKRNVCTEFLDKLEQNRQDNEYAEYMLALCYVCDDYDSMFIQYPIIVESISTDNAFDSNNEQKHVGEYVMIQLNLEDYDEDVHLGLYLGELPTSIITLFDSHDKAIRNKFMKTPAIYVYKFKKLFYGSYQRWKFIESIEDFDLINDSDIEFAIADFKKNDK